MSEGCSNSVRYIDLIQSLWSDIAICLELQKKRLYEETKNYPTPITACDQQFNYLLEEQAAVSGELRRMHEIVIEAATTGDAIEVIEEFVRSSNCIDETAKQRIQSRLLEGISQLKGK